MPPQKPLPTASDTLPDQSVTADKLAPGTIGDVLGTEIVLDRNSPSIEDIVQNTGTKPLLIIASGQIDTPAQNDADGIELLIESANPPTIPICAEETINANLSGITTSFLLIGIVLPGQFYQLHEINKIGTGSLTLSEFASYAL